MWYSRRIKFCVIAITVPHIFSCVYANAATDQAHTVDDLPYGVALYNFYQGKYFSSITDILVAKKTQTIEDKNKNAELLMGSLYLSYGLQKQAHEIFKNITLTGRRDIPQNIFDQALFHVGKDDYVSGFEERAKKSLLAISDKHQSTLSSEYESERLSMLSDIYLRDYQYTDVLRLFEFFPENSIWEKYAKFNLGVSFIKNGRSDEGLPLLESISKLESSNKEINMLQDQSNLALAVSYVKKGKFDLAVNYFKNIKLENPQSSSALLGLGWAKYELLSYKDAIGAWLELSKRSKSDSNVQEALMLIPYVLEKTNKKVIALNQYNFAVEVYLQQLNNVKKVKALIKQGEVVNVLRESSRIEGVLESSDMIKIMGPELSDYLFELIVSNKYKQAVNNYRELMILRKSLSQWKEAIPALDLILNEKINTYNGRLPDVISSLKFEAAKKRQNELDELVVKFEEALKSNATMILANKEEKELFNIFNKVKSGLDKINNNTSEITALKDKYLFLLGVLEWRIGTDYAPRVWAVKSSIKELENELQGVHRKIQSLMTVWDTSPAVHQRFRNKIKGKNQRIKALMREIDQVLSVQEQNIQAMAESAVDQYRDYLKKYHDRALFARARLYSSMVRKQ